MHRAICDAFQRKAEDVLCARCGHEITAHDGELVGPIGLDRGIYEFWCKERGRCDCPGFTTDPALAEPDSPTFGDRWRTADG